MRGLSLVAASGGHSSSRCAGLSLSRPLLLRSTGSRHAGSAIVVHGPSRSAACGIFPDQGSNRCPLHWQADSQPLRHQGSPRYGILDRQFLSFSTLNASSHYLLDSKVSVEKYAGNLIDDSLYVICHFSLAAFRILSLSVSFKSLIIILAGVGLSEFTFLGVCRPS